LVVDDEFMIAQDLKETLENLGYQSVFRCSSYSEATSMLKQNNIDLVMLDINLNAKESGLDLAEYINKNNQIPFIYLTSYSDKETIEKVKHTKPVGFLLKPYNRELLSATIEIALFNYYLNKPEFEKVADVKNLNDEDYEFFVGENLIFKDKKCFIKIPIENILWFESDRNYIDVITIDRKYTIRSSLKRLLENLPDSFLKCHRQYLVNLKHITGFNSSFISIGDSKIPVSRSEQELVLQMLRM
jgi:DNA-binding LytR/AlgR family response regulator